MAIHDACATRGFISFVISSTATFVDRDMRRPPNLMKSMTAADVTAPLVDPGLPTNYLDLYGLSKPPFGEKSDRGSYILFGSQRRMFETLVNHLVNGSGVLVLLGEEGTGKSETMRSAATVAAESGIRTIMVSRPPDGRIDRMQLVSALEGQVDPKETTTDDVIRHFLAPPRKALLVDDIDLMPGDCVRLLLSLTQPNSDGPASPAVVLSSSIDLTADQQRPDLSQLLGLSRDTLRISRLGAAELRQYIERLLWVAGGTTRRLITPNAMKLLVARSGGVPGVANRVMEAALMAGFARGDVMITDKTVAAAMGPTARRPTHTVRQPSGTAGRTMQIIAAGLLVLGIAMFLIKGLSDPIDHSTPSGSSAPSTPAALPAKTLSKQTQSAQPAYVLPPDLVTALIKRGNQALDLGDIAAARLLFLRAAGAGNASAATALGKTYDPNYVAPGGKPDRARAVDSYQKAIALGDPQAADLLRKLGAR